MINLFRNKQRGGATLIISVILIVTITLLVIFAAQYSQTVEKLSGNQLRSRQAFQAAEAGLEFGIVYFQQNSSTILANPVNGYIPAFSNSSTANVSLANGSQFTITYTNPVQNNYHLILVSSTGTSADGTTSTVSQEIAMGSLLMTIPNFFMTSKGPVSITGSVDTINSSTNQTIQSASTVTLSGSAQTHTSSGLSSSAGHIGSDIQQNSTALANLSQDDFIASYFGTSNSSIIQSKVGNFYSNSSSTNYASTLDGMTGTSIWIDQTAGTASISGNTVIGSTAAPVLLIVNGNFSISGNVTINGFVFVISTTGINNFSGNVTINGGLATSDTTTISGNVTLSYSNTVLSNLQNLSSLTYWAKVPGSWKDF